MLLPNKNRAVFQEKGFNSRVSDMNCSTESRSGRKESISLSGAMPLCAMRDAREFRSVLRRCPKAVFTTVLKNASSTPSDSRLLRVRRNTPLLTLAAARIHTRFYVEEIFAVVPCLQQYGQYAVYFRTRSGAYPLCHFLLKHACHNRDFSL